MGRAPVVHRLLDSSVEADQKSRRRLAHYPVKCALSFIRRGGTDVSVVLRDNDRLSSPDDSIVACRGDEDRDCLVTAAVVAVEGNHLVEVHCVLDPVALCLSSFELEEPANWSGDDLLPAEAIGRLEAVDHARVKQEIADDFGLGFLDP